MTARIDLSDEQLHDIVSEAILQAIDEKQRDAILQEAVRGLLERKKSGVYGDYVTPIQEAFNLAVEGVARNAAREMMDSDEEIKAKVRSLLKDVLEKIFGEQREKAIDALAEAFRKGLTGY